MVIALEAVNVAVEVVRLIVFDMVLDALPARLTMISNTDAGGDG